MILWYVLSANLGISLMPQMYKEIMQYEKQHNMVNVL